MTTRTSRGSLVRRILFIAAATLLLAVTLLAEIIPPDRRINWDPGIPGGIPPRTTIYTTLSSIDNTGASDVTGAIQNALNQCPANQVVRLPVGTFRIDGSIVMPSNVTLRGMGPSTLLKTYGAVPGLFRFGQGGVSWDPTSITTTISSGANKDSTSIVVASATGISVGTYLVITEVNDPAYVANDGSTNDPATWVDAWNTSGTRAKGQIVEVTSVSGTTIGFKPALYSSYTRTPWATRFAAQCKWSGVEDLKTYANNTGVERNFFFQRAAYCWVNNVECDYTDGDHVTLDWSYRCEVRHSYFHDAFIHHSGNFDTMVGLRTKTTACLVIDNIIRRLMTSIMVEWGAAGNVVAYNYDEGNFHEDVGTTGMRWLANSYTASHGAHPQFNLFEGNVGQKFKADSYWGTSSDGTVFRNYFSGTGVAHPPYTGRGVEDTSTTVDLTQANRGIDIWELQSRYNVVGNVVGSTSLISRGVVRKIVSPASRGYDNPPYCFSYGYISDSDSGSPAQTNPTTTLIEHGNYDVKTGGVVWDSGIPDHNIPDSLFLAQKPAWFGTLTYPPIDPTRPNLTPTSIPAGYRYINGTDPPTGTANQAPKTSVSATPTSGIAPLVVTFSSEGTYDPEGATLTYKWDFGDGTSSSAANPSKTYQNPGNYTVRLTASDGVLSTDSTSLSISVLAPRTGLVAAFAFDEGSGTSTQDSSGNGNEGTITRASWVDGKYGNALAFNGTDALVSANSSASLAFTSAVTVEAWVYPQAASAAWRPIAFKAFDASRIGYVLQGVTPQSVAAFFVYPSTGNLVSPSALPVNTWSHLAGTYDGSTMRMYVNGVEISSKAQTGVLNVSTEPLTIGGSTLYGAYWNGLIDEVRVYSRAISPSEIQSDMATPIRPAPPTGLHVK